MDKVEALKEAVTKALREKLYPLPPFGMQVLLREGEVQGVKVYLPLTRGLKFDPETGDILLGSKVLFQNGILGKTEDVYVQVRLARWVIPGLEIIRR